MSAGARLATPGRATRDPACADNAQLHMDLVTSEREVTRLHHENIQLRKELGAALQVLEEHGLFELRSTNYVREAE